MRIAASVSPGDRAALATAAASPPEFAETEALDLPQQQKRRRTFDAGPFGSARIGEQPVEVQLLPPRRHVGPAMPASSGGEEAPHRQIRWKAFRISRVE